MTLKRTIHRRQARQQAKARKRQRATGRSFSSAEIQWITDEALKIFERQGLQMEAIYKRWQKG